jgi:hypothetical protein
VGGVVSVLCVAGKVTIALERALRPPPASVFAHDYLLRLLLPQHLQLQLL